MTSEWHKSWQLACNRISLSGSTGSQVQSPEQYATDVEHVTTQLKNMGIAWVLQGNNSNIQHMLCICYSACIS